MGRLRVVAQVLFVAGSLTILFGLYLMLGLQWTLISGGIAMIGIAIALVAT